MFSLQKYDRRKYPKIRDTYNPINRLVNFQLFSKVTFSKGE